MGNRVNAYTSDMDFHGGSKLSKLTYPIKTIYSKEARVQLRKVLDDFKPDVCHLNNFNYQLTPSIILEIVKWRKETGRDCKIIFTAHDYQLVCPNHMLNNPNTHQNCEKCLGGHFVNCMKGKCIHGSTAKSAIHQQPFDWDVLLGLLHKKPPRRSSYEAQLSDSDSLVTTTQIAKEYGCGAKVFNRLLHLHGIQYRANGQWVLYSEHHGKGYTSSLTFRLQRSDGSEVEKLHTAWTQKGRKFLYHTLKRRGVLPLAEQGD